VKHLWRLAILPLSIGLFWFAMPAANADFATAPSAGWYPNNGTVYAMSVSNGVVYLGGSFTSLRSSTTNQTVSRSRLAAVDATTGAVLPWNPGADGTVRALSVGPDGTVYAGGDFQNAAGAADSRLAAITTAGNAVPSWNGSANNTVRTIIATAGGVYVAGNFARVDNVAQNGVALLDPATGARITSFNANVGSGKVRSMTLDGSTLYVGGSFTSLSGQPRSYAGAVDASTGAPTPWAPDAVCTGCQVLSMTTDGPNVFAAVGGPGGGRAISWAKSDDSRNWQRHADGDCQAIAVAGGQVYVGGHFGPDFNGSTRHQLAVVDEQTGNLLSYSLPMTGNDHPGLWALSVEPNVLRIAGGFAMSGTPIRRYAVFPLAS
jgi:trimeric autotransporter adhesin